jgi:hypothetical protein
MEEEYQVGHIFQSLWLGAWGSVNDNLDVYIFQDYNSSYYLLAYSYDKESQRGNFSCYEIVSDKNGYYACIGMKRYRLQSEEYPYGLHIGNWGRYMKN